MKIIRTHVQVIYTLFTASLLGSIPKLLMPFTRSELLTFWFCDLETCERDDISL